MKNIILIILLLCSTAKAADVKGLSNHELLKNIASHLSAEKNKKNNKAELDMYKSSFDELDSRVKNGNPSAHLYRGLLDFTICGLTKEHGMDAVTFKPCVDAFNHFEVAASTTKPMLPHERAQALSYKGEMYVGGFGVAKSNILAANSFVNAAVVNIENTDKENALLNLERALQAYPEHPKARRLLKGLLEE